MTSQPTNEKKLRVPLEHLPRPKEARHSFLRDYFCDKDAIATEYSDGWQLDLQWPGDADRHIDPLLAEAFSWWGHHGTRASMYLAQKRMGKVLLAMYDTWTLHSWSEWIARTSAAEGPRPVILHIDDHRDLGAPRLVNEAGAYKDLITGHCFDVLNPASVKAAILSGAVGMGSFMTPFLHALPASEVRHLCQPPKVGNSVTYKFLCNFEKDSLLLPGALRPSIDLHPTAESYGGGTYHATNEIKTWLAEIPEDSPILLHIDMDYFNNRYDGDSDWALRESTLDPTLAEILSRIDEVTDAIIHAGLLERIEDIVIAFSPGFFPAEYWQPAYERLIGALSGD